MYIYYHDVWYHHVPPSVFAGFKSRKCNGGYDLREFNEGYSGNPGAFGLADSALAQVGAFGLADSALAKEGNGYGFNFGYEDGFGFGDGWGDGDGFGDGWGDGDEFGYGCGFGADYFKHFKVRD